jgi:preprotein translocase subunit YajC
MEFIPLAVLAVLFWFLIIRPQRRRSQLQNRLADTLERGQDVVTAGGLYGRIKEVGDEDVQLEIAPEIVVRVDKRAVSQVVPEPSTAEIPR